MLIPMNFDGAFFKIPKIIAVDFDGTLFNIGKWPEIIGPNMDIINAAKQEQANGAKLILWTCREGIYLDNALKECAKYNLHFDAINENIQELKILWGDSRKVSANEYWDDRNYMLDEIINRWKEGDK